MRTRRNFVDWATNNSTFDIQIEASRFMDIHEREYVFGILNQMLDSVNSDDERITDFKVLEERRYEILKSTKMDTALVISQINGAISFCDLVPEEKVKQSFRINPLLTHYLAQSAFSWEALQESNQVVKTNTSYFFIPSFLSLAPKEAFLSGLNSVLLDLIDYTEVFHFNDFLQMMKDVLPLGPKELENILLNFVTAQCLYYQTFLHVN